MSRFDQDRFDPAPDPDLVCCICQAVLDGPLETPCRHVFCKICIETWLSNHQTCPSCRKNTQKEDLRPVLPIIQNMVNRLQMKCRNYDRGCTNTFPLENIDSHELNCGYEPLHCRFRKCRMAILKKDKEEHEEVLCQYREIKCTKNCGLLISVKEIDTHDCLIALKTELEEQRKLTASLQQKAAELTSQRHSLEQQLGNVEHKLEEALRRLRRVQDGSVSDQLSDFNDDASTRTWNTEYTLDGLDDQSVVSNNTDISVVVNDPAASPVNLLTTSQDSIDRSHVSETSGGNSPIILFSSHTERGVRVNVQGNASLSYIPQGSQSSGSETSGFIAESSGYGQSPIQDLDRYLTDSEIESNHGNIPASPEEQRPASPEPPYSMNESSDDDADSIVEDSPSSPVHSHYSLHTMSDSDTADAVRDILNITPPPRAPTDDSTSRTTSTPKGRYNLTQFSPTNSADDRSEVDDLQEFSSSDDVSDETTSDIREEHDKSKVQPFYSNDVISDDDNEFVNNSPSATGDSDAESQNGSSPSIRGFLSTDSDSDASAGGGHQRTISNSIRKGKSIDSDNECIGDESNLTFSVSMDSNDTEDDLEEIQRDTPSQPDQTSSPRSRKQSEESEQIDLLDSLLDHFGEENMASSNQSEGNKNENTVNDDHVAKSLDKLTEALEEMEDEADEMEAKLRKGDKKSVEANKNSQSRNDKNDVQFVEVTDDESYVDVIGLVNGNMDDNKDPVENSLSLRDHLASPPKQGVTNTSSILNTSESSVVEINSVLPSNTPTIHSRMKNEISKTQERPAASACSRQSNGSRTRQTTQDIKLQSTSIEQDRHIELLEEQYALKTENKNLDVERYVNHVQKMMSYQDNEVKREKQGSSVRPTNNDYDIRHTLKRKCDQQSDTAGRGTVPKKAKHENTDRSDRPQRVSHPSGRNESSSVDSSSERPTNHVHALDLGALAPRHKRNGSSAGMATSNVSLVGTGTNSRKIGDKKHSWDPKNLNISLNVAINLDKAARGSNQATSSSTSVPVSDRQAGHSSRRSAPSVFKQRERITQERIKFEGNQQQHQHRSGNSDRLSTSRSAAHIVKTDRLPSSIQGKSGGRSSNKATSTVSKPPPAATVTQAARRPQRRSTPLPFPGDLLPDSDTSSDQDVDWEPVGNEPSDVSITSSENEEEHNTNYKLKIPIPTATLLEKYKDYDDSDDSWSPPV